MRWMVAIVALALALASQSGAAQTRLQTLGQKNDPNRPIAVGPPGTALSALGANDPLRGLFSELNEKALADFRAARDLAATADANGVKAYPNAEKCFNEIIPVLEIVQKNAGSADGEGVVTAITKIGILRRKVCSDALRDACAPLRQEIESRLAAARILGAIFDVMKCGF